MRREVAPDGTVVLSGGAVAGSTGPAGPEGPAGPPGPRFDETYSFNVASNVWTCVHNQGPLSVEVETYTAEGKQIVGDVSILDPNTIQISWYFPTTGTARVHT